MILLDIHKLTSLKKKFVPYDQFRDVEFIAEGGFSKIYKATWINHDEQVVLKKLNNSKNITSKELNELKIFYDCSTKRESRFINYHRERRSTKTLSYKYNKHDWSVSKNISRYFGITRDPITEEIMIVMPYYSSGDLIHYITNKFYKMDWYNKLLNLSSIISGLIQIHSVKIVHRDLHSGNIFIDKNIGTLIGDLGISKSATESTDDDNENYGIIPYMAPEIFQGQKYTMASDIYSFGMIMWELMTGRRPFWDQDHDTELIIKICDGLRPPIVTNAPEGYIELMKECWHSDPSKRPAAEDIFEKINKILSIESIKGYNYLNPTKIVESPDIGPVTINNPGAFYKSRPLNGMIHSAMSLRSSRNQSINLETDPFYYYQKNNISASSKRKSEDYEDNLIKDDDNEQIKRRKVFENENSSEYFTKEIELNINTNFDQPRNNKYITKEIDLDINAL